MSASLNAVESAKVGVSSQSERTEVLTPETTTREDLNRMRRNTTVSGPLESRCPVCSARITTTPEGRDVGHKYRCPERDPNLPVGGGVSGGSYYDGPGAVEPDAKEWGGSE